MTKETTTTTAGTRARLTMSQPGTPDAQTALTNIDLLDYKLRYALPDIFGALVVTDFRPICIYCVLTAVIRTVFRSQDNKRSYMKYETISYSLNLTYLLATHKQIASTQRRNSISFYTHRTSKGKTSVII